MNRWQQVAVMLWLVAAFIIGFGFGQKSLASAVHELNCLHRAAEYPVNISAKFAADVCSTEPLP